MQNYRGTASYYGAELAGWQRQANTDATVQAFLEGALEQIFGLQLEAIGAGRTDAGVHARAQVFNFFAPAKMPPEKLLLALNNHLPDPVAVTFLENAPPDFHALACARRKWYRYRILNRKSRCPLRAGFVWFIPGSLAVQDMQEAAGYLCGCFDFSSFCAAGSGVKSRVRRLEKLEINRVDDEIVMDFIGPGFLYKMVRNIVGTLVLVGKGKITPASVRDILEGRDRNLAGPTAPACGLILMQVEY